MLYEVGRYHIITESKPTITSSSLIIVTTNKNHTKPTGVFSSAAVVRCVK